MISFKVDNAQVRQRITATISRLKPESPEAQAALFKIGTLLRAYVMDAMTGSGAVDTGALRGSLQIAVESSNSVATVAIQTMGKKYARIVDQGGAFTPAMRRAMFAAFRERGRKPRAGKGIVRGGYYRGRPYMAPAAARARPMIMQIIEELVAGSK